MKRREIDIHQLRQELLLGNRYALSKAITLVESTLPQDQELASQLFKNLWVSESKRIGISGSPGVGKSSFIEALGLYLVEKGNRVAVLAIDPSSPIGKGSILGDKTRMETLSQHEQVFIRPSASSGELGGVARKTRESILLCEAAGFNWVLVETVGVGQSEVAVRNMVDFFLLLVQPAGGDEVQGIKKGIVEMADLIAVTKADGNLWEKAKVTAMEYKAALHYYPHRIWKTEVLLCSAQQKSGIADIVEIINSYYQNHSSEKIRREQNINWLHQNIKNGLKELFYENKAIKNAMPLIEQKVRMGEIQPHQAAEYLLGLIFRK